MNKARPLEFSSSGESGNTVIELERFQHPESATISELKKLRIMHRRENEWVTDVAVYGETDVLKALSIIQGLKKLKILSVSKINDNAVQHLSGHNELEKLTIGGELSEKSWTTIASLPKLNTLRIHDSFFGTEAGTAFESSVSLKSITFTEVKGFDGLKQLNARNIRNLEFRNCWLSDDEAISIATQFNRVDRLTFRNTEVSDLAKQKLKHLNPKFN